MSHQMRRPSIGPGPAIAAGAVLTATIVFLTARATIKPADEEIVVKRFQLASTPNPRDI